MSNEVNCQLCLKNSAKYLDIPYYFKGHACQYCTIILHEGFERRNRIKKLEKFLDECVK